MSQIPFPLNRPQLLAWLVDAPTLVAIMGRGTGKSEGIMAPRICRRVHTMKRCAGVIVGATYQQILTRTLPALIAGWQRMGYQRDTHFFIQKKAPKSWDWYEPYISPVSADYFIHWYTGSGIHMISQDRPGTSNGLSIDFIEGDEAKFLNRERLEQELFPTNRGNNERFGEFAEHHGLGFYTDMPIGSQGQWLFQYEDHMDREKVDLILALQNEIAKLTSALPAQNGILKIIKQHQSDIEFLRRGLTYFLEADSFENLQALGIEYFEQMKRVLTPSNYNASILNLRRVQVEGGFYASFDENKHCYDAFNYSYFENQDYDPNKISAMIDCRQDADLDLQSRLEIATDTGGSLNGIVVGQEKRGNQFSFLNSLYVLHPFTYKHALQKFIEYYRFHKEKTVWYWHDHTMIGREGKDLSFREQTIKTLSAAGWTVVPKYIGQQPNFESRYELWGQIHKEMDPRLPKVRYNRTNCQALIESMQLTELKQGPRRIEKNKKNEQDIEFPQEKAPHLSDAADTMMWGKCKVLLKRVQEFADIKAGL